MFFLMDRFTNVSDLLTPSISPTRLRRNSERSAGELSATQTKLKKVESELVSLNKERDQIQADSVNLAKKKDILAKAVTPEWGTIHSLSLSIISFSLSGL
mgnify:FL=1